MRRLLTAGLAAALVAAATVALAQGLQPSAPSPAAGAEALSLWGRAAAWVLAQQRALHGELAALLRDLSGSGSFAAAWALIAASFLYGVFHAAGPGHGKAILATYLLTHETDRRRGLWLAAASALCQGLVAIVLVYGLILLVGWLPRDARTAVAWSERASFALVALIGLMLCLRAARSGLSRVRARGIDAPAHGHADHGHADHGHADHGHAHHGHAHHGHVHDAHCGHAHLPDADAIARARGLRATLGVILSIGLRPCTGAVLVLVLAYALAIPLAGVAAVLAMSAGTALAVAALAVVAVGARRWAGRAAGGSGAVALALGDGVALLGGALLVWLGASLLMASFGPAHPLGV